MNVTKKHLGSGRNRIELTEINNPNDAEAMLVLEHFLTENRPSDDDEAVCLSLVDDNERVPVLIRCKAKDCSAALSSVLTMEYDWRKPLRIVSSKASGESTYKTLYEVYMCLEHGILYEGEYLYNENGFNRMHNSVTSRINEVSQPPQGYLNPSLMTVTQFEDNMSLGAENLPPAIIGLVVDYLTRYEIGYPAKTAFAPSIQGYVNKCQMLGIHIEPCEPCEEEGEWDNEYLKANLHNFGNGWTTMVAGVSAFKLLSCIKQGLSSETVRAACQLVAYDSWFRNPYQAFTESLSTTFRDNLPDEQTIENIRIMVNRSIIFLKRCKRLLAGFTFAERDLYGEIVHNGYTDIVSTGDGDYLSEDTVWDFKVSKYPPTKNNTLQLLMYYLMGKHSGIKKFEPITRIGVYNPRLNASYVMNISDVPAEILTTIEQKVICY